MDHKVRIREATIAEVPLLAAIRAARAGSKADWSERIAAYMAGRHHPQKALAARVVYVAEEGNIIVGLIAGHLTRRYECDGELQWIDVTESRRSSGIATALLRYLAQWFVEQNAKRVCVDVAPDNTVARNFYRKHGALDLNPHWLIWPDVSVAIKRNTR